MGARRHRQVVSHPDPADRTRFEALYRAHYGAVLRFAARRANTGAAEEVAAETFATAWRRLEHVADKEREHAATVAESRSRDPAEALAERDAVVRAFLTLSEPDREALRLVAWDERLPATAANIAKVRER